MSTLNMLSPPKIVTLVYKVKFVTFNREKLPSNIAYIFGPDPDPSAEMIWKIRREDC